MFQVIGVIIAAIFVVFMIDVPRIAVVTAAAAVAIAWLALVLWHRRKLAELRELHVDQGHGQFSPVQLGLRWPKRCRFCHQRVHSWREASAHQDPEVSACAALRIAGEARAEREHAEAAAAQPWTAEVIPGPRGGIDTLTDEQGD